MLIEMKIWKDVENDFSLKYNLGKLTKDELKNIVKTYKIKGFSKLKKDELVDVILTAILKECKNIINEENNDSLEIIKNVQAAGGFKEYNDEDKDIILSLRDKGIIFTVNLDSKKMLVISDEVKEIAKTALECEESAKECKSSNEETKDVSKEDKGLAGYNLGYKHIEDEIAVAREIAKLARDINMQKNTFKTVEENNVENNIDNNNKIGRNDQCPCGSGKKYKKCCLNK